MTHGVWINKVAISSIEWLNNPLSAPAQQLLPTRLAPHFMSLNRFSIDFYKSPPGTREAHANQMCFFSSQAVVIWYPPTLSSLLGVSFIITWTLYNSHGVTSFSSGNVFVVLFTVLSITALSDRHCANCALKKRMKKGDFDMIEVIIPADNNEPIVVLFSTPPQAHQNCQKSLLHHVSSNHTPLTEICLVCHRFRK